MRHRRSHVGQGPFAAGCRGLTLLVMVVAIYGGLASIWPVPGWATTPPGAQPAKPAEEVEAAESKVTTDDDPVIRVLRIAEVRVEGLEQVRLRQIERILEAEALVVGAEISWPAERRVERVRDQLRATGYFKQVILRLQPTARRDEVNLIVDLQERGTVAISKVYLGNSLLTPFRGGVQIAERNFLGRGIEVGGAMIWGSRPSMPRGQRQQAYRLFVEAPRLGRAPVGMLGAVYGASASEPYRVSGDDNDPDPDLFRPLDYTRFGGLVGLTFPVLPDLKLGVDFRFEWVRALTEGLNTGRRSELDLLEGGHRLTSAHFALVWDGRDEAALLGKGGRIALDLQLSSPALGSEYEYIKLVVGGAYTVRLPWKHWFTPRLSGGQIAGRAPRFERFYAGDLSDWTPGREQGLIYSTRRPIDVFGTGIDASSFGVIFGRFDLEYAIPLFRRTKTRAIYGGHLFLSTGVFTLVGERDERDRRRDAGEIAVPWGFNADFGVRLDTAIGRINLSVGNVLQRTPL